MEMKDITWALELIIAVLALVTTRYIIPWLKRKIAESNNDELDFWIDFAVRAAEERYKYESGSGQSKFIYVKDFMETKGFTYDDDTMSVLIDGKVRELFNWDDYNKKKDGGSDE